MDTAAIDIRKFLPELYQSLIIIITQSSQVEIGYPIQIHKLGDVDNSLKILSNASRQEGLTSDKDVLIFVP